MFLIIYNNFLEVLMVTSSMLVLLTMIYFVSNISKTIEEKIIHLVKNNKDLKRQNFEFQEKLNKYNDESEIREKLINKLVNEKEEILDKLAKLQLYNEYVSNLEKENQS